MWKNILKHKSTYQKTIFDYLFKYKKVHQCKIKLNKGASCVFTQKYHSRKKTPNIVLTYVKSAQKPIGKPKESIIWNIKNISV